MQQEKHYGLFIDTTQDYCTLGLIDLYPTDPVVIDTSIQWAIGSVSNILVKSIKKLLNKNKVKQEKIKDLFLVIGPGSFTGSRMGFLVAKAWIATFNEVNLHIADALRFLVIEEFGIGVIDAKSNKKYIAIFNQKKTIAPQLVTNDQAQKMIDQSSNLKVFDTYPVDNLVCQIKHILKYMVKVNNVLELQPLYLKNPI